MAVYTVKDSNILTLVKKKPFGTEKEMQTLVETNLQQIFDLLFIKSEFTVNNFRIDTLAFDTGSKAFVVVEYKKNKNFSVIDQGYAYLSVLLNNKADFILEYNENSESPLKKKDVDWSQSRVLFVAPSFTPYQRESINFKDLPIELWEINQYENKSLILNKISPIGAVESVQTVQPKSDTVSTATKEIRTYTEEELLNNCSDEIVEGFHNIREEIHQIDNNITEKIMKTMICYYSDGKGLAWVNPNPKNIRIHLRKGDYKDSLGIVKKEGWGGYPQLTMKEDEIDIRYLRNLFEQAYDN